MPVSVASDTRNAILDAAINTMIRHGVARTSLGEIAQDVGVSRQTVYRYFRTKDDLVTAAILREESDFADAMIEAAAPHAELRPALEAAVATALRMARSHPLFNRLLQAHPDALLPWLTTNRGPIFGTARPIVEAEVAKRLGHAGIARVRLFADTVVRLLISYAVNPPDTPIDEVAATLADILTRGLDPSPEPHRRSAR